jgi:hypothetical protein
MSDIIASARSMTTYSDGQYVAVGFPKGGLTPATITAMVGFSQGEGLQMNPSVSQAVSALSNVANTSPLYGNAQALSSRLSTVSSQIMAGGPAAFMQKFNSARGHIADTIEIKKMTAFTANTTLDSYGSGMKSMSSLSSNGLDGALGNMAAAGAAMAAAGPLFDLSDVANLGSPVGLINKLTSSKLANTTGINAELTKAGINLDDLSNPVNADKISKVMSSITDPVAIKTVADQFGINPPGGLPEVGKQSFASLAASIPSYGGADSSLATDAAATLLGGGPPPPIQASPEEPSSDPVAWTNFNNLSTTPVVTPDIAAIDKQLEDMLAEFRRQLKLADSSFDSYINEVYALDFGQAGVIAQRSAIASNYEKVVPAKLQLMFDQANQIGLVARTLPKSSSEYKKWATLRNGNIESELERINARVRSLKEVKRDILAKIAAAGGS